MTESLSIVVIGRNEGQRLRRCLESISEIRGTGGEIEVIYVDSSSSDGSPELARNFGAEVVVLDAERSTAALGRNAGWQRARAPFILFLDGDTVLHPGFPGAALETLAGDASIAAVWGHRREIHPERSVYNRVLDLDWVYPPGDSAFCGGDVLMRRSVLEETDGYDPALIAGEEPELCRRLRARGYRILHIDSPMTGHDLEMTRWGQYWKRATRAGHAYAEVARRFRGSADPFWTSESRGNLLRGGFWILSLVAVLLALIRTPWPLLAWCALVLLLVVRSAWRSRWKAPGSTALLLLYGIHSHLQQIPILVGQMRYYCDRRMGRRQDLIEYRQRSGA